MNDIQYSRPEYDISTIDPHWADAQMVKLIGTNKRVLEIGCASGHFGKYLKNKAGCKVWAFEIDARLAELASPHYEKVYVGDIQQENVFDQLAVKEFDVILCSNVLEHTADPLPVLKRLKNFLAKNSGDKKSYFVIALPNVAHFSIRLKLLFGNFDPDQGILGEDHLKYYTLKKARQLIENAGLKIDYWSFDSDKGIPKFDGLLRRLPSIGSKILQRFYSLRPALFGFQFIFKCSEK